jgi:hypothetical protein
MGLINQGGKLLLQNGALASGSGCCCGQCNPATCPTGTECQPPCVCVNGQCVSPPCSGPCDKYNKCVLGCGCNTSSPTSYGGECVRSGAVDHTITTEAECEECVTECEYTQCDEYMYVEEGQSCPEGWQSDGWGGCYRTTYPSSCGQCNGYCYSEGCTSTGNCGQWVTYPIGTCDVQEPCRYGNGQEVVSFQCPDGIPCCNSANAENNSGPPYHHFCGRTDVFGVVCWPAPNPQQCWDNISRYTGVSGPIDELTALCTEPWAVFVYGATSCEDDPCGYNNPLP